MKRMLFNIDEVEINEKTLDALAQNAAQDPEFCLRKWQGFASQAQHLPKLKDKFAETRKEIFTAALNNNDMMTALHCSLDDYDTLNWLHTDDRPEIRQRIFEIGMVADKFTATDQPAKAYYVLMQQKMMLGKKFFGEEIGEVFLPYTDRINYSSEKNETREMYLLDSEQEKNNLEQQYKIVFEKIHDDNLNDFLSNFAENKPKKLTVSIENQLIFN